LDISKGGRFHPPWGWCWSRWRRFAAIQILQTSLSSIGGRPTRVAVRLRCLAGILAEWVLGVRRPASGGGFHLDRFRSEPRPLAWGRCCL